MTCVTNPRLAATLLLGGLALSACHPVHRHGSIFRFSHPAYTRVLTRLTCPDREGDLTRVDMAADGQSCRYVGRADEQVSLTLLALNGASPATALAPLESDLRSAVPITRDGSGSTSLSKTTTTSHSDDHTHIDLPGLHIDTDGDRAQVHLPGVSIDSDGDKAKVHTGFGGVVGADISADKGGATIRAGGADADGADLTFILASDTPGPDGVRAAGYLARGPASGPLVVASFKARRSDHGSDHDRDAISRLVDLNVGR